MSDDYAKGMQVLAERDSQIVARELMQTVKKQQSAIDKLREAVERMYSRFSFEDGNRRYRVFGYCADDYDYLETTLKEVSEMLDEQSGNSGKLEQK